MRLKKSIKRGIAAVTITGIMASSAMPAFAKDYHIEYGDIKVDQDKVSHTDKDGTKYDNEKNEDGDITITGKSDENTVSVKDADVTFKDLEIDRSASSTAADGAAVSVSGNSSIELDGKNTISSGMGHAGIEKADDNGTMTIKDDNNVSGSLTANGGFGGAGIGGGKDDVRGEEIAPDISGIDSTGQGYINYYDSDNNLLTRVPSAPAPEENDSEGDDAEPALSASMKQAVSQLEVRGALRQNLMQDTSIVQQDYDADAHVLTIRAELSIATLTGTLGSLKALQAQGVTTIALVTQHCTSTLDLAELTALGGEDTVFSLVHTAGIPALSVGSALHNELIH